MISSDSMVLSLMATTIIVGCILKGYKNHLDDKLASINNSSEDSVTVEGLNTNKTERPIGRSYYVKCLLASFVILYAGEFIGTFATSSHQEIIDPDLFEGALFIAIFEILVLGIFAIIVGFVVAGFARLPFWRRFAKWMKRDFCLFLLSFAALAFIADVTGITDHSRFRRKVALTGNHYNPIKFDGCNILADSNIFGIKLSLPGAPKISKVLAPMEVRDTMKNGQFDQAIVRTGDYEVVVARFEYKDTIIDLEGVRTGGINDLKSLGAVSDVSVLTGDAVISGRDALWSKVVYTVGDKIWDNRSLIFSEASTLWIVSVTGEPVKSEALWSKIKDSVEMVRQ